MRNSKLMILLVLVFISYFKLDAKEYKESDFLSNIRQLIYDGKRSGEGYFSKTGDKMVFQSERLDENPFYQIYMLDFETGDVNLVSTGSGKTTCAYINPINNDVLFASTHLDPKTKEFQKAELDFRASGKSRRYSWDYDPQMDIFVTDANGKNIKRLTKELGYDAEAAYSPDGKKIVLSSNRKAYSGKLTEQEKKQLEMDAAYFCDLYIMDADGKNIKKLTDVPGYDGGPFFSPDGKKVIFRRFGADGHSADIYTIDIDGKNEKRITEFSSMSWAPFFHPSGEYIIFASNKFGFGNFEIFIVDKNGEKEPIRVSTTDGFDGLPVFHPNGNKLVWTAGRTENKSAQLFIGDWNHQVALESLKNAQMRGKKTENEIQFSPEIKADDFKAKVTYLASDELEGRFTGSEGIRLAAKYIKNIFRKLNLENVGNNYATDFEFIKDIEVNPALNSLAIADNTLKLYDNYIPHPTSEIGKAEGDMVFVGYGIKTPNDATFKYNSYNDVDVKDKFVLVLSGMPSDLKEEDRKVITHYDNTMHKVMVARELGAKGIIFITDKSKFDNLKTREFAARSGLFILSITKESAEAIFTKAGKNLSKIKESYQTPNPHGEAILKLENQKVNINVSIEKKTGTDNNVVGMISATNKSDDYIFFGAHYDHLGHGQTGSRAEGDALKEIHNGADDNASGTALVLELAEYFADLKIKKPELITKNLVFCFWSGEELGLLGSQAFCDNSPIDLKKGVAYLNFDMVGMLKDNKLMLQGLGSSPEWRKIIEKKNVVSGFNLSMSDDPYLPTDATSFYKAGLPVIQFFTGLHDHYHKPTDDTDNLNFEGMAQIGKFAANISRDILAMKDKMPYEKVVMTTQPTVRGFGVYLGTIPDYGAEVVGVKISGVRGGAPAEKAGLTNGDIIKKFGGRDIKNIYDYTNILAEIKAGEKYDLEVERNGKIIKLEIIPASK